MTQLIQIKRSETPNNEPVGLQPGELAVEMATPTRLWVGVPVSLEATGKKLLIDLSGSGPGGGITEAEADLRYVNIAGDTMSGPFTLSGNPTQPLEAAPKQYVDQQIAAMDLSAYLLKSGGAMTGYLSLIPDAPIFDEHAANKLYVDSGDTALQLSIDGKQNLDATLTGLADLDATSGLVEQIAPDVFNKRAIGVGSMISIPTRGDADARYAAIADAFSDEKVDDRVAALLVPGPNILIDYNDTANTITISSEAGGTTIIDGIVPPLPELGNEGEYYVDTAAQILYGPKRGATSYFVEHTGTDVANGNYTLSANFKFSTDGLLVGCHYFLPAIGSSTIPTTFKVWDNTTLAILRAKTTNLVPNQWNDIFFDTPLSVTAGTIYRVGVWLNNNGYNYTVPYVGPVVSPDGYVRMLAHNEDGLGAVGHYATGDDPPDNDWSAVPPISPLFQLSAGWGIAVPGMEEAPTDGQLYSRRGSDQTWQLSSGSGGGIAEAPLDGKSYGRRDGLWDWVISHNNDIVDGGNF